MATHSIPGTILFPLFVVFFVFGPFALGCWWAGFNFKKIDRQDPKHILTLAVLLFVGLIASVALIQTNVLSGSYSY